MSKKGLIVELLGKLLQILIKVVLLENVVKEKICSKLIGFSF